MSTPEPREPLPLDPLACRQTAERALTGGPSRPAVAIAWALLGVAGELSAIRRELARKR